jgi:ABC-2 type transport system permease protein
MRAVLLIAGHDLKLTLGDRGALLWMLILPIVFAVFLGAAMGGGSGPRDSAARLTVIDHDGGAAARALVDGLASERLSLVELDPDEPASSAPDPDQHGQAQARIRTLIIPEGFTEQVLAGEQATLRLEKDPGSSLEAGMVAQARIYAAIARLIGDLVAASQSLPGSPVDGTVTEDGSIPAAPVPPETLAGLPPAEDLVRIEARFAGARSEVPDGFAQSVPGNLVMFVLLVALTGGAASLAAERRGGQLRRLVTAPLGRSRIIIGKMLGRLAVASVQVALLVLVGTITQQTLGVGVGDRPLAVLAVLLVFGAVVSPLAVAFGAWFRDPERAASLGAVATMVMASLGGCWWPIEIVGRPMQLLALAFPTGWAMRALHGIISYGHGLGSVTTPLLVLLGFAAAFTVLAVRALRLD